MQDLQTRHNRLESIEIRKYRKMYRWLSIIALGAFIGFYGAHIAAYFLYFNN